MLSLGIETSCDETSIGIISDGSILANYIYSQAEHQLYGGVVPEIASRAHLKKVYPLLNEALNESKLSIRDFDIICSTAGPGLLGALIVGFTFGKSLAYSNNKQFIPVNHILGHLYSVFLSAEKPEFPFISLIVSGGHTSLYVNHDFYNYELIGSTLDDAAGEAFDKVGKLIGLKYPAGAEIESRAKLGDPRAIKFQIAKLPNTFNFSFSGIKTSVLRYVEHTLKNELDEKSINDICASFQKSVIDILIMKIKQAALKYKIKNISITGGVAANRTLKSEAIKTFEPLGIKTFIPEIKLCSDNGAMIAYAGLKSFETKTYLKKQIKQPFANINEY